jgi:ankyrin repeat protein
LTGAEQLERTALMAASRSGHTVVVEKLVQARAHLNQQDKVTI